MAAKPRISFPSPVSPGQVIEVKTLISHVMETGQRRGPDGQLIPRNIIHTFKANYNGRDVFTAELNSGVSANPYIAFHLKVQGPGELLLTWIDDSGAIVTEKLDVAVA